MLFLLMAAPVGMGGCIITDGVDDTEGNTNPTGTQTSGETDPGTTSTPTPGTTGSGGTTEDPPATDSTGPDPTEGNDTTAGEGTTTGDPPSDICTDYANLITGCYNEEEGMAALDYCGEYIQGLYDDFGKACVTTYEDYLACLSVLSCEDFMGPAACDAELMVVDKTCVPA